MHLQPTPETILTREYLDSLVAHRAWVDGLEEVGRVFETIKPQPEEFFGVLIEGRYVGLISKAQVALVLSGRFGYAIYARQPIERHLLPGALVVRPGETLLGVLDRAFRRPGAAFHHDLAVVDENGIFLGVLPMPTLVRLQNEIIAEQVRRSSEQRHALENQELQLLRREQQLRQSERRFGILFESGPHGFALLTTEGRLTACNRRCADLLNVAPDGPLPYLSECLDRRQSELVAGALAQLIAEPEGVPPHLDLRLEAPGGESRLARCTFHWIPDTRQVCLCAQDITHQRRIEQRLQQKEKSALLDSLAGGIAHELNNKLTPTLGFADLLAQETGRDLEFQETCRIIRQSVEEAAELVQQLLQLSRPPALQPRACDLAELTRAAVGILRFRLRDAGCEPILELPEQPVWIQGDPPQIKQVIMNLGLNALDAMATSVRRELRFSLASDGKDACLRVRDSGGGIAPQHLARIFDPFFTTKHAQHGTGLGLSVCLSIIQQHAGSIEVESTGSDGTVFACWLPLSEAAEARAPENAGRSANQLATASAARTVLVVDDEPSILSFVQQLLRRHFGCRLLPCVSAEAALARLNEEPCDLILSDVRLPGMNGLEFHHQVVHRWPALAERFIFMTGDAGSVELQEQLAATGRPVLRKPFGIEAILATVRPLMTGEAPVRPFTIVAA